MRNSGLRVVAWGVFIIVVVGVAAATIGYRLKLIGDQRTYVDINSGDVAHDRTILGHTVSHEVMPTDFANLARQWSLARPDRNWQQTVQFSWISGTNVKFPMNGADVACAGAMWRLRNEKTDADKKQLLARYVKLLQAGDVKGMIMLSQEVGKEQEKRVHDAAAAPNS